MGGQINRSLHCQSVSQLHYRTIILYAISAKLQKLFVNRYNQAFYTNSCQNIGHFFMVLRLLRYLSTAKLDNQAGNANNTDHSGNIKATGQNRSLSPDPFKASQQKAGDLQVMFNVAKWQFNLLFAKFINFLALRLFVLIFELFF